MTKNPSWIQFTDDIWGEPVGSTNHDDWLRSLDAPELPASTLDPLPDLDAPLVFGWLQAHLTEQGEAERVRVVGPHGLTFQRHADKLAEVAHLDAARRAAIGDLRDQTTRQHREAKQELSDFERSPQFQTALKHYLDAAGPAFERIAATTPENPAAVLYQQEARARYEALRGMLVAGEDSRLDPPPASKAGEIEWQEQARKIADEIHATNLRCGSYSTNAEMADAVSQEMRKRGIHGPRGPLSAPTVLKEALQGGRWKRKTPQEDPG